MAPNSAALASKPARRPRRDRRRERNRQALIEATVALVMDEGSGALSMARIAKLAGVHHRAFYAHFRNVEDCLEAAIAHVAQARHTQATGLRDTLVRAGPPDFAVEVALTEDALRAMLQYRQVYLLLLRCRHEQSKIGAFAREEFERSVREITDYVWRGALHYGARVEHLRELETLARYMTEGYAAMALDVLEGRASDVHAVAESLTRYHWALIGAELKRLLPPSPPGSLSGRRGTRA